MLNWLTEFLRDIRFGVRHLAKSPGFTSIAVLSLTLGIMATTAIYSVIHAVVLDPFPYKDEGHTDNVDAPASNKLLSENRARIW
jgi:putative ABC transport system permease protein